jgi:hypothetical protein
MDYKEKYEEALERAKAGKPMDEVFPELKESEDERIRRKMVEHFKSKTKETWCNIPVKNIIAYLEKKKEQKPTPRVLPCSEAWFEDGKEFEQKEQKPAEWSEKDEAMLKVAIAVLRRYSHDDVANWLKTLRPQPHTISIKDATKFGNLEYERGVKDGIQSEKSRHWKPSEEQMITLIRAQSQCCPAFAKILQSIHDDLKKL